MTSPQKYAPLIDTVTATAFLVCNRVCFFGVEGFRANDVVRPGTLMGEVVKRVNAVFCLGFISSVYLRFSFLETFLTQAADLYMGWFAVASLPVWGSRSLINRLVGSVGWGSTYTDRAVVVLSQIT